MDVVRQVLTDPALRIEGSEILFSGNFQDCCRDGFGRTFDVNAGGTRFLMSERPSIPPSSYVLRVELIQNWLDEVRRRLRD